jgi:DNA polymerase-3 subunit chi
MRADFYLVAGPRFRDDPLRLACELVRKAHDAGMPVLVLARDAAQAEALDDMLWDMGEDAYIPHQIAGQEDDDDTPVLIADPSLDTPLRPLVLNLRDDCVPPGPDRVLEVVPADDAARGPLRERWKQYKARGLVLNKYDM